MGFWSGLGKIAAGAVAGVGAVALFPVSMGVTGGVLAGALVGAVAGDRKGDRKRAEKAETDLARKTAEAEAMREDVMRAKPHAEAMKKLHGFIVAAFAVGICAANCDGEIHPDESLEIDEFIAGILIGVLPSTIVETISRLRHDPPNINQALDYVIPFSSQWDDFESIIEAVIGADGIFHPKEIAFKAAWAIAAEDRGFDSRFKPVRQAATA